jgi:hypothetical protein
VGSAAVTARAHGALGILRTVDAGSDITLQETHRPVVLSRHAAGLRAPASVQGKNITGRCRIPGSPFSGDVVLVPNRPGDPVATLEYGPFELPLDVDTFTFLCESHSDAPQRNTLRLEACVADEAGTELARATVRLAHGDDTAPTARFEAGARRISLAFSVSYDELVDPRTHDRAVIRYVLGYKGDLLADIFNRSGSDKGTAVYTGRGVPHCYALEYARLFEDFREETFNLLEIGLSADMPPTDVPSLRAFREYFPAADIYGYDIEDFGFVQERDIFTFQGSQASRGDLRRFLETFAAPEFRIVIDDGSHASSHQQVSLGVVFPQVEPSGFYVIEDLGWQPFRESPTTLQVLRHFTETRSFRSPYVTEEEARYLEGAIDSVEILKPNDSELAVIRKRGVR